MNPAAILTVISELRETIASLQDENTRLKAELAKRPPAEG